jgi:hypothetical protein
MQIFFHFIIFISLSLPLVMGMLLLAKKLLLSKNNTGYLGKIFKCVVYVAHSIISILLMVFLFYRFILDEWLPKPFSTIGGIFFFFYYFVILTFIGGLGAAGGHTGVSPIKIVKEIFQILTEKK